MRFNLTHKARERIGSIFDTLEDFQTWASQALAMGSYRRVYRDCGEFHDSFGHDGVCMTICADKNLIVTIFLNQGRLNQRVLQNLTEMGQLIQAYHQGEVYYWTGEKYQPWTTDWAEAIVFASYAHAEAATKTKWFQSNVRKHIVISTDELNYVKN